MVEFQKALVADPSSGIALQDIRDASVMIRQRARMPAGTVILTPAEQERSEVEKRIASLEGPPQLQPLNSQVNNLRINNQPARVLYETVGKLAGINVLFDPTGFETTPGKNFNLDLGNVTLEEALNLVALETHTFGSQLAETRFSSPKTTNSNALNIKTKLLRFFICKTFQRLLITRKFIMASAPPLTSTPVAASSLCPVKMPSSSARLPTPSLLSKKSFTISTGLKLRSSST